MPNHRLVSVTPSGTNLQAFPGSKTSIEVVLTSHSDLIIPWYELWWFTDMKVLIWRWTTTTEPRALISVCQSPGIRSLTTSLTHLPTSTSTDDASTTKRALSTDLALPESWYHISHTSNTRSPYHRAAHTGNHLGAKMSRLYLPQAGLRIKFQSHYSLQIRGDQPLGNTKGAWRANGTDVGSLWSEMR